MVVVVILLGVIAAGLAILVLSLLRVERLLVQQNDLLGAVNALRVTSDPTISKVGTPIWVKEDGMAIG